MVSVINGLSVTVFGDKAASNISFIAVSSQKINSSVHGAAVNVLSRTVHVDRQHQGTKKFNFPACPSGKL